MKRTVEDIAKEIGGKVFGNGDTVIVGLSGLQDAQEGQMSFLANPKYALLLKTTQASAVIVDETVEVNGKTVIRLKDPSLGFSQALALFAPEKKISFKGIHPSAVIADGVSLGKDVAVGPHVVIEEGVTIGDRTIIGANSFIGHASVLGEDDYIYPNVSIQYGSILGNRVVIYSGTVIGSDGFGFATDDKGIHIKIPQIGIVEIHDDVEIGANVTIDRARFDKTVIGAGTKIDNLVQIAHNVRIGKGCLIVSQVGISGSTVLEDYVVLGGQVGVAGHLTIGKGTKVGAQSGVSHSLPAGGVFIGYPAQPHMQFKRSSACVNKLPDYVKTIRELKAKVEALEQRKKQNER